MTHAYFFKYNPTQLKIHSLTYLLKLSHITNSQELLPGPTQHIIDTRQFKTRNLKVIWEQPAPPEWPMLLSLHSLQWSAPYPPQNCFFTQGDLHPHLIRVYLGHFKLFFLANNRHISCFRSAYYQVYDGRLDLQLQDCH